jgi:outer membrane protein TolC
MKLQRNPTATRSRFIGQLLAAGVVIVTLLPAAQGTGRTPDSSPHLTLSDAVSRALREAPEAKIARLEADRAGDAASAAQSSYWPHASLGSQAGYSNRLDEKLEAVDGNGRVREYGLASLGSRTGWLNLYINQLLFDLSRWKNIKRTELEAEAARIVHAERREAISFQVLEAYANVLRRQRLLDLDRVHLRRAEWLDEQAEVLLRAGEALPSQREQVALHLDEARMAASIRNDELAKARTDLVLSMGGSDDDRFELVPDSLPTPGTPMTDSVVETRLQSSPELRVLELRAKMEELRAEAARAEAYPTLGLRGGYSHYGAKRFDNFDDELHVGVDFEVPLFSGFRIQHSVAGANKAAQIARLRYRSTLENKRTRIRDLSRQLAASRQRPELAQRKAKLADERLRIADLNLRAQKGSLDLSLAARAQSALEAEAAVEAEFEPVMLWAQLEQEAGLLSDTILGGAGATEPANP